MLVLPPSVNHEGRDRATMKAIALSLAALSLLALTVLAPPAAAYPSSAQRCGFNNAGISLNCGSASLSAWTDLGRCVYGREINPGIWEAYCPIILTIDVSATEWVGEGGWSVAWGGWCGNSGHSWPATNLNDQSARHTCEVWPYMAARCDYWPLSRTVDVHFRSQSVGGVTSIANPGSLTVEAYSQRPQPPGGC